MIVADELILVYISIKKWSVAAIVVIANRNKNIIIPDSGVLILFIIFGSCIFIIGYVIIKANGANINSANNGFVMLFFKKIT